VSLDTGTIVDGFEVMRLVGRGGFGEVYLARDTRLGRKVVLKLLRLCSGDATGAFLREARATARFSHPHIVTVHAVGEHGGRPYMALEYVEGETLRARLAGDPPAAREALRLALGIAEGVREAHRHGVLHRDLKPENVLLGKDGRVRVADFGLARLLAEETGAEPASGTPAYMAPEQWLARPCTPATDVFQLGLVLHELVHGRLPFALGDAREIRRVVTSAAPLPVPAPRPDTPPALAALVERCLAKEPDARPPAAAIVETIEGLLALRPAPAGEDAPFPGLLAFTEGDADTFFGREAEVLAFVERARETPVLAVVGLSGAGKSSFVQAGVVPRLRERGSWTVVTLRPGARPFAALARALLAADPRVSGAVAGTLDTPGGAEPERDPEVDAETLAGELRAAPGALASTLRAMAAASRTRVLLFVDQLEEAHTHVERREERRAFLAAVCAAADDRQDPVRVFLTVRDDFLGRLAEDAGGPEARAALSQVTVLGTPGPRELAEIVVRPVERAGYRYEDAAIVEEMVEALRAEPAGLPLLQFAARTLWDRRDRERRLLRRAAYDEIGGVAGALADHAERTVAGLTAADLQLARQALLALVTPERTRRAAARAWLPAAAAPVIDRLVQARLLTARQGPDGAEIELAHESLIERWARLRRWIDESREELVFLAELEQAARLWERRRRNAAEVWSGAALAEARLRVGRLAAELPALSAEFVAASEARERRQRRRRRLLLGGAAAALVAGLVAALVTNVTIRDKERMARQRLAESLREGARAALGRGDPFEARARLRSSLESEDALLARALWWQLAAEPLHARVRLGHGATGVAVSPDGARVAVTDGGGNLHLIDPVTRAVVTVRGLPQAGVLPEFTPDGARVAAGTVSGHRVLVRVADQSIETLGEHDAEVIALRVTPAGLWSIAKDGSLLSPAGARALGPLSAAALSPDARRVALATGAELRVDGAWARKLDAPVRRLAFSRDGALLAVTVEGPVVRVLDAADGEEVFSARTPGISHDGLAFAGDGKTLAVGGSNGTARIFTIGARGGDARPVLYTGADWSVGSLAFSPDDRLLVTTGDDEGVRVWRVGAGGSPAPELGGHSHILERSALARGETRFATAHRDGEVGLWDLASGLQTAALRGHTHVATDVAWSLDDRRVLSSSLDGTIRIWDAESGRAERILYDHGGPVHALAVSPTGELLASAGADGGVRLWALPRGDQVRVLPTDGEAARALAFAPDGRWLAAAGEGGVIRVFDLPSGAPRRPFEQGARVFELAASRDGRFLAASTVGERAYVRAYDLETREAWIAHQAREGFLRMGFRPDGRLQIVEPDLILVDLAARRSEKGFYPYDAVWNLSFTSDGRWWLDGARMFDTTYGQSRWYGTVLLGAKELLTHDGWARLDPGLTRFSPPPSAWRADVDAGREAWDSDDGRTVCHFVRGAYVMRLRDRHEDRLLREDPVPVESSVMRCVATAAGYFIVVERERDPELRFYPAGGGPPVVTPGVTALSTRGAPLYAATSDEILALDPAGKVLERRPGIPGVAQLAAAGDEIVVATRFRGVGTISRGGARLHFQDIKTWVLELIAGPPGTAIVGFIDGTVGLWRLSDGVLLGSHKLGGPIGELAYIDRRLYVVTERGETRVLDLSAFEVPYCDLLAEVQRQVPVVWEAGAAVRAAPPAAHRCARAER
jgi:WD40 repeat protein